MSNTCGKCGAPVNPALTVCEFCGAAIVDLKSAADELKAIEEMIQIERRMSTEKSRSSNPLFSVLNPIADIAKQQRVMGLWTGSFIPNHPESIKRLLQIIILKAVSANMGTEFKDKYVARAQSLLSTYRIQCVNDPEYGLVVSQYEAQIAREAKKGQLGLLKWMGLGLGGFLLIAIIIIWAFGGPNNAFTERKCKGEVIECEQQCQLANCLELCEDDNQWACQLADSLRPSEKK